VRIVATFTLGWALALAMVVYADAGLQLLDAASVAIGDVLRVDRTELPGDDPSSHALRRWRHRRLADDGATAGA
jgi:hypothetical protein